MSFQGQGASGSDVTTGSAGTPAGPPAGGGEDDSSVTQSQTTGGDATSGAAADCSMATDSSDDYNKLKYHSSKMDLNLMILRDQMTNLQSSGSSLSRQLASMYRTFQEIKDDDEGEDADSEYESEDEQRAVDVRDAVDTEDDVNKMSDLEKDYSEPKFKRSLSSGSRGKKPKNGTRESNVNEVPTTSDGGHRRHSKSSSVDGSGESYQDSDSDCSQCLCCNSMASYSSTPWRYVSRGGGSTMDEDSDSSEYFSDESEYSTTTCTSIPSDVHKRHSPFYSPSDGKTDDTDVSRFEDAEPVVDLRMSPLGCESPRKCNSQPDSRSLLDKSESTKKSKQETPTGLVKPGSGEEAPTGGEEEKEAVAKASSLIGIFKEQEEKAQKDQIATIAKAKRVEELRRKNSEIRLMNEKKRKAQMESRIKGKTEQGIKSSPLAAETEETEKLNIKDRISSFEKQGKSQDKDQEDTETLMNVQTKSGKFQNVEKGTNTEQDASTIQQMPDLIPDVTEGKIDQGGLDKGHRTHKPKSKLAKTTIEIPVSCLPEQVVHPESGAVSDRPTMMTFQVRPVDVDALGGPRLVARSPKPKRRMSKTIVRLSSTGSPPSVSEATLVSDTDTVKISGTVAKKPSGHSHHVCPHCQKKSKPGESKRVMKVLQLQPVPESPDMPPLSPIQKTEESAHIIQHQAGGQIIQMIPSHRHGIVQRQESSKDGVVFRFNMGIPENAPLQVGDYIRIPIQPQQPKIRHQGGGVVIRTGGQSRRPSEVLTFSQSAPSGVIVQPSHSPTSGGVTVHMGQPGVRVMPSKGGGVKLVFGS